ncbi:MAG: aminotransferase class V-fold PLP-dependent enzyme [Acidimicrobiales bacterium]|nr:aminotransferase class V-fold PLP-dependent enzyme [Acidimicrobiales bacterium]
MPPLDVHRARALTPGCEQVVHLNHAGASLLPQPVLDAVLAHVELEARMGGYEAGEAAAPALARTHEAVATLIGARGDEIALVESATTGWGAALHAFGLTKGDRIVIGRAEYGSNAMTLLQLVHTTGCELVLVDDDEHGQVDLDALERTLADGPVALVSLVHVPTGNALVNPVAEAGRLCRAAGVPLIVDACQSVGQLPVEVDELGCDVLTASGRKFLRGPRGAGFLYVRSDLLPRLEPRTLDLHGASWVAPDRFDMLPNAGRFEQFDASIAGRIGLGVAVDHALGWGLPAIADRIRGLAEGLRARLSDLPGVVVRDAGLRRCAITTFTVEGVPPGEVQARLRAEGVNIGVSRASQAQLDIGHRGLDAVARASVHYVTTDDELDRFVGLVASIAG